MSLAAAYETVQVHLPIQFYVPASMAILHFLNEIDGIITTFLSSNDGNEQNKNKKKWICYKLL